MKFGSCEGAISFKVHENKTSAVPHFVGKVFKIFETPSIKIDLACSFAARAALESMGDSLRAERPYIKSLDATQCVIDLTKVPVGTKMLSDFIVLNSAHIPAQNGPFAELNVTIKPL